MSVNSYLFLGLVFCWVFLLNWDFLGFCVVVIWGLLGLCVLIWGLLGLDGGRGGLVGAGVVVDEKNWGKEERGGASISSISSINSGSCGEGCPRPPSNIDNKVELKVGKGVVVSGGLKGCGSGLLVGNLFWDSAPGSSFWGTTLLKLPLKLLGLRLLFKLDFTLGGEPGGLKWKIWKKCYRHFVIFIQILAKILELGAVHKLRWQARGGFFKCQHLSTRGGGIKGL